MHPGLNGVIRLHGAFVSDEEILNAVKIMKKNKCNYLFSTNNSTHAIIVNDENIDDDLYEKAVEIVIETKKTSISFLQRQLRIGFNRAARLIEIMEQQGIVGVNNKSGNKEVLVHEKY
jgi:S-DNA-T family DNA segregation ATPase FtsK/SpoIIIE